MKDNYYIILGIPAESSQGEIKAAYRKLAKKFHPDHYGQNQSPFQTIQKAYDVLGDPGSRKEYDSSLKENSHGPASVEITTISRGNYRDLHEDHIEPLIPDTYPAEDMFQPAQNVAHQAREQSFTLEIGLTRYQAKRGGYISLSLPVGGRCPCCFRGERRGFLCRRCNGAGFLINKRRLTVNYPPIAGSRYKKSMRLRVGLGQSIDLNLIFTVL